MSQGSALKFVVDIQNEEKINELTKDIKTQETAIKALNTQLKQGTINEAQFTAAAAPMGEKIRIASAEIKNLHAASGTAGRGLSQLSYAIDDVQYGFNAIVNNIPQIVMGFGAGAGVAGAVGIAAVAINQLIKHWGELSDMAQSAWAGGSIEQLHNIRKAAEEATKAFDKLTEVHTKMQEATEKFTKEAFVEGPIDKIFEAVTAGVAMDKGMAGKADEGVWANMKRLAGGGVAAFTPEGYRKLLADEAMKKNQDEARKLITAAADPTKKGDTARRTLHRMATENPGAFPKGFAEKMSPEAAEKDRVDKLNIEANIQGNKNIRAAEKKAEEERLHANKELTAEGIRFEKQMKHEQLEAEKRDLQESIKKGEHLLTGEGKKQLQDKLLGGKAPEESKIMSVKAFADKMLTAGMNTVPQKQLERLEQMHLTLKDIDKKLREQGLQ